LIEPNPGDNVVNQHDPFWILIIPYLGVAASAAHNTLDARCRQRADRLPVRVRAGVQMLLQG